MIDPLLTDSILQAEGEKVKQLYDTGYELYDTAEHITHSMVSVGNLLRLLGDIMKDSEESAPLKDGPADVRLMMFLEDAEETMRVCGEALTACEDSIRDIRTALAHLDYKKCIPTKTDDDGTKQTCLEVGA